MTPLNRKLLRDLWRIKGQALAIGSVIAVGVLMLVMMTGLVTSLDETRRAYYERYRLADIFAPVTRAPVQLLTDLAAIPGVAAVEGRINGSALIDMPGIDLPIQAQAVSLPGYSKPRLNDVYLTEGRLLDSDHADEILLLRSFADAHDLKPGDKLTATMQGARRSFRIVGLVRSPEFLYTTAPGELAPDPARFGVIWMSQTELAAAYDMQGAFNEALLSLERNGNIDAVIASVDRALHAHGSLGAYGLDEFSSNRFVSEEIDGLRASSKGVPPIFLAVAAFLLYIVISRTVHAERGEIGLMKAFGYSNTEVGLHYMKLVLAIAVAGALAGCLLGVAAGRALVGVYQGYFKFPFLIFQIEPSSFFIGLFVSIAAASAGGLWVLRSVFALTPATAMHAPAPTDYSRAGRFGQSLNRLLDQPSRMVLRRLTRQPGRMFGSAIGIAAGMALSVGMMTILTGFDRVLELSFSVVDRSDMSVSFSQAVSGKTIFELQRIPGVIEVEPVRFVPAILRNGRHSYRGAIYGLEATPTLYRALDDRQQAMQLREEGVILATALAQILHIVPGDYLTVDVREGRQPTLNIPVIGIAQTLLGSPAYMELQSLNRALHEPHRVSGAYLRIDDSASNDIYQRLKKMPVVAGVSIKNDSRKAFQKLMDEGAGAMRYVMVLIAAIITFGIVYNSARIAYAERARDLASLRVMGFSENETAFVLLGELAVVTLIALPVGAVLGYFLSFAISAGFSTDLYQIPTVFTPDSYGTAALAVIAASIVSGWLVKRDISRTDLVSALKTRE